MLAGLNPNSWLDTLCMLIALIGVSLPSFWIGMILIYVFGMTLAWVPIVGSGLSALILPSITVGLFVAGGFARLARAGNGSADTIRSTRSTRRACRVRDQHSRYHRLCRSTTAHGSTSISRSDVPAEEERL